VNKLLDRGDFTQPCYYF